MAGSLSPLLKSKAETFSALISYDEAVLRVWHQQLANLVSSIYKLDRPTRNSKGFGKATHIALSTNDIADLMGSYEVARNFLKSSRFIISNPTNTLHFIYSKHLDSIYNLASSMRTSKSFDDCLTSISNQFPAPSWYRVHGVVVIPVDETRRSKVDKEFLREHNPTIAKFEEQLNEFLGIDVLQVTQEWVDNLAKQVRAKRCAKKERNRKKYKKHLYENMTPEAVEAKRAREKKYREEDRERYNEYSRNYNKRYPERRKATLARSYQKKKERENERRRALGES